MKKKTNKNLKLTNKTNKEKNNNEMAAKSVMTEMAAKFYMYI